MIRVCSGFSPRGFDEYGKAFLSGFHRFWPAGVDLQVYTEIPVDVPRGSCLSLWSCDGVAEFIARHRDNPERCGSRQNGLWKPRYHGKPYCYRFDAVKFCRQMFIPEQSMAGLADGDTFIWIDADVLSFAPVPSRFLELLVKDHDIAFLGRAGTHSEIGFWAVRIGPQTRRFVTALAAIYRSDAVFELPEWHSAFVFDHCRSRHAMTERDLTPGGRGHVWTTSPLAAWTDHVKGARKTLGYSPERKRMA